MERIRTKLGFKQSWYDLEESIESLKSKLFLSREVTFDKLMIVVSCIKSFLSLYTYWLSIHQKNDRKEREIHF